MASNSVGRAALGMSNANLTQVSPLVAGFNMWGNGVPTQMPRQFDVFESGAFGPGTPIMPMPIDSVGNSGQPDPRRFQYPVAWNLPVGIPGSEGLKLVNFYTLRAYGDLYSVARACIDLRIKEILGLGFDIQPTESAKLAMAGSNAARTEWEQRKVELMEFWEKPDRSPDSPYQSFEDWFTALLEDLLVLDAVAIYLRPTSLKNRGPFNSGVASLDLLDGSTIRPLISVSGGRPKPPNPAYQQYIWGVPRVDSTTMLANLDVDALDEPVKQFSASQMMYLRWDSRTWTPYGFSPLEKVILPVSIGYARQNMQLEFFTEGTIPAMFVVPGPEMIEGRRDITLLQNALNQIAGDTGWKQKIIVLPPNSRAEPIKPNPLADQFDEFIVAAVTMGWGYTPLDLGIAPRIAAVQSPGLSKEMSNTASENADDRWLVPLVNWLGKNIFDYVNREVFGQKDMKWVFPGMEEATDLGELINDHTSQIKVALESVDEARTALGRQPWGTKASSMPLVFTGTGVVPLDSAAESGENATNASSDSSAPSQNNDEKPEPKAKADDEDLTTPAHEAARNIKPTSSQKFLELNRLRKVVSSGRSVESFVTTVLPKDALDAFSEHMPDIDKAYSAASVALALRARRDTVVDQVMADLKKKLAVH